jgi:hypothetical protein
MMLSIKAGLRPFIQKKKTGVPHNTGNRNGTGWLGWRETTYLTDREYKFVGSFLLSSENNLRPLVRTELKT